MCGCLVALAAFLSPRFAIFLIWLFTDRMSIAFDSFWWGLLGFIFLPWTTLAWAVAYAPIRGRHRLRVVHRDLRVRRRHHDPRRERAGTARPSPAHRIARCCRSVGSASGRARSPTPKASSTVAQTAESLGFDSIWVGEHPVLIDPQAPPSPLPSRSEMMDPVPVLAYAAAATSRIQLGTGIVILPLRNPVILAKQLATVDVLSRGRLLVGIGVGYVPGEYDAIGVPFATRGRRADEWIDALRTLWRDDEPRVAGRVRVLRRHPVPAPAAPARRPAGPGQRDVDRGPPAGGGPVRRLVRVLPGPRSHPGRPGRARRAWPVRSTGRPNWAGWRSPSRPCRARSMPTPCAATRTSASTGWCWSPTSPTWRVDPMPRGVASSSTR